MSPKKAISEIVEQKRKKQRFFKKITLDDETERCVAYINLESHELNISYPKDWAERYMDRGAEQYLRRRNIKKEKALELIVSDMLAHEVGHRGIRGNKGCPETAQNLSEKFLDPMYEATKIENKGQLQYLSNCLMDVINNTLIKKTGPKTGETTLAGMYLFFKEQQRICESSGSKKFGKMYEAHVRLNLYFNGSRYDKELLEKAFTYDPEINKAIQNFLQRTGINKMKAKDCSATMRSWEQIRNYFENEDNWKDISKIYAEEFSKFLEEQPTEKLFGSGGNSSPNDNKSNKNKPSSDNQNKNQGNPDKKEGSGNPDDKKDSKDKKNGGTGKDTDEPENKFSKGDGFGEELDKKDTQKEIIRKRAGTKAGKNPGWMTNFEHLVALYELLASDKTFELTPPNTETRTYPLINLDSRTFDFENDQPSDITGMHFDSDACDIELETGKHKYSIAAKVKNDTNNRPELVFALLDTSSSMLGPMPKGKKLEDAVNPKAKIQWDYNSKYHSALVAYFMAVQKFKELKVYEADVHFANFSNETIISRGLDSSLRKALHPQFGGTQMDMNKIEKLISKRGSLIFTISDGEIGNSGQLLEKISEISEYNPYFHVQIGEHSTYSNELAKNGLFVKQVMSEDDLYNFVLDMTDKVYGGRR